MLSTIISFLTDKIFLIGISAVLIPLAIFYGYFRYSQDQIATLEANVASAKAAIAVQQQTISDIQAIEANQKVSIETMQAQMSQAEAERARLAAAIRSLNIIQNAQTNRPQLQQNLNTQLNDLFKGIAGDSHALKSP